MIHMYSLCTDGARDPLTVTAEISEGSDFMML